MSDYDLIIMGGGPAGYLAAERAGARGKSVLLVEERHIGGVCLNEGCVPTKTLLYSAKLYHNTLHSEGFGVVTGDVRYDLTAAMAHKARTIQTLRKGILAQMKHHGVTVRNASAELRGPGRVAVDGAELTAQHILIATGGESARPPIPGTTDNARVVTSREILEIETLPERLVVVGGGYIGMEFASYFATLGVSVTVVEMASEIIPMLEPEMAASLRKQLPPITYHLGTRVGAVREEGSALAVEIITGEDTQTVPADLVLIATGRVPRIRGCGFEAAGLDVDARHGVRVDEYMRTNLPGVYAAGDVTGKMLLAHAAYRMGEVAVDHMYRDESGGAAARGIWPNRMRYHAIPWVVFTAPEVAGCGLSPSAARDAGLSVVTATLPLRVSGRYLAEHPRERGTVTMVAEAETGRIVGVQMLGSGVGEIIHSAAIMIEQELCVADVREIVFPHPTVSEAVRDAAWGIEL